MSETKITYGSGVLNYARELILKDKFTNRQIWDIVQTKYPDSRLGIHGVSWCRAQLRKEGHDIKSNPQLKGGQ